MEIKSKKWLIKIQRSYHGYKSAAQSIEGIKQEFKAI